MSVDVYLISQIQWKPMMVGQIVAPAPVFKVGYSHNPLNRLQTLRTASNKNLALFGVILCGNEERAQFVEAQCHDILRDQRGRGEWFKGDVQEAWLKLNRTFSQAAVWLTDAYDVDLDSMQLVPFKLGAWGGISDHYHSYREYKEQGVCSGIFSGLSKPVLEAA